jgi:hypothetical protein
VDVPAPAAKKAPIQAPAAAADLNTSQDAGAKAEGAGVPG